MLLIPFYSVQDILEDSESNCKVKVRITWDKNLCQNHSLDLFLNVHSRPDVVEDYEQFRFTITISSISNTNTASHTNTITTK